MEALQNHAARWIDTEMKFKKGAIKALKNLKAKKTFKPEVTDEQRFGAFVEMITELAEAYEMDAPKVKRGRVTEGPSDGSHFIIAAKEIVLVGRLSIITALHEFAHARGMRQAKATRWSLNLFNKVYPKQFAKLIVDENGMARKAN